MQKIFFQKMKNYTFLKSPWPCHLKYAKVFAKLIFNQEKLKMRKFPLTGCLQKICNFFFAKLVQFVSLCQRLSKKLNFSKIWQVEVGQNKDLVCYGKKQSFRQCAWGLSPVFGLKGGIWVCRKSLKISQPQTNTFWVM